MKKVDRLRPALCAAAAGTVGSIGLTLYTGSRGGSPIRLLMLLFVGWVSLPYAAFAWAALRGRLRSTWLMFMIAPASLAVYSVVAFGPPRATPAFTFLMTPLVSLVFIAAAWFLGRQ